MEGIYPNMYSSTNQPTSYVLSPQPNHSESYGPYRSFSESPRYYPHSYEDHQESPWPTQNNTISWNSSHLPPPSRNYYQYNTPTTQRPKLTTTVWEDEGTICYQVDAKSVCVARRQDNDMINGTKLLNVVGMSRGKRDGILKNEKGRVVVKVGAMHLKGVWITFSRAKDLATKFKIFDILYPLFVEDPSVFLSMPPPVTNNYVLPSKGYYKNEYPMQWNKQPCLPSLNQEMTIRTQSNLLNPSENEMYMMQSPGLNRPSALFDRRFNEKEDKISFPSSPPPEMKYQEDAKNLGKQILAQPQLTTIASTSKDTLIKKGRKRIMEMNHSQNKRLKE